MKKDVTYIDSSKFETIVQELGCQSKEQAGFIKVSGKAKGRQVYVARTKRVGRVDISGFLFSGPGVTDLGGSSFGAVHQQLDFSLSEESILLNFRAVLEHMLSLPDVVKEKKVQPGTPKKAPKAAMAIEPEVDESAEKAARLARIQAYAAKVGAPVSLKTIEELAPATL